MLTLLRNLTFLLSFTFILTGCTNPSNPTSVRTNSTYIVVVGMENSQMAGACPGSGYDADRMYNLLSRYTSNIVKFRDNAATKANVVKALTDAVDKVGEGLVIFYYSGHGGSDPFPDTGVEEIDGKDEYLLLWDTYLRDNEIWSIISKSKGRFFFISDSCHSETQFRAPGFKIQIPLAWDHNLNEKQPFSMLCWSGCPDTNYSYGSSGGGQFTNALLRHFDERKSYETLWNEIKSDGTLRAYENPQSTAIGNGFDGKPIFR